MSLVLVPFVQMLHINHFVLCKTAILAHYGVWPWTSYSQLTCFYFILQWKRHPVQRSQHVQHNSAFSCNSSVLFVLSQPVKDCWELEINSCQIQPGLNPQDNMESLFGYKPYQRLGEWRYGLVKFILELSFAGNPALCWKCIFPVNTALYKVFGCALCVTDNKLQLRIPVTAEPVFDLYAVFLPFTLPIHRSHCSQLTKSSDSCPTYYDLHLTLLSMSLHNVFTSGTCGILPLG